MAIISTNMYGDIMTVNPAVRSIFGYLEGELEGESFLKLVPELESMHYSFYDDFTSRGELELFDAEKEEQSGKTTDESNFLERFYYGINETEEQGVVQTHKKNGESLWVSLFANRVNINANVYYIVIISDITETKLKEQEITQLNESLERRVEERTQELEDAHSKVSLLLDSSAQGFLAVDYDLLIDPEYSKACEDIFGQQVAGQCIADLMFPGNKIKIANLHKNIKRIIEEEDDFVQDLYLHLLNDEYTINNRSVEVEFKYIPSKQVVLILTDITKRKKLEHKLNHERDRLKFIVATVQDPQEFFDLIEDFEMFVSEGFSALLTSDRPDVEKLEEVFRQVHTYKGNFSQLDFLTTPLMLHQLEDQLKSMQENSYYDPEGINELIAKSHCLESLKDDLDIIESVLGSGFMANAKEVTLNVLQVERIEKFISEQDPGPVVEEVSGLLKDLLKTRLVNVKTLFRTYPKSSEKLALSLEKAINPFEITGKDLLVDSNKFAPFTKSLVHVFRNAVDHGIESPDERVDAGKDEIGNVSCHIKTLMDYMVITIADDGRGLDLEKIKDAAVKKGMYSREQVDKLPYKTLSKLIFDDRFSTKAVITTVSGRGIGLAAVRAELVKLKGDVKVTTKLGEFTKFQFVIPYNEDMV